MKISKDVHAQARRLMRLCMSADGVMNEDTVRQVATTISERKPRNYIPLLAAFTELVRLYQTAHTATITSAVPLSPTEQAAITSKLSAKHNGLLYQWQVDPALIAGITVRVGDQVTDASVKSRIERLSRI